MHNKRLRELKKRFDELNSDYDELNDLLLAHDDCNGCDYCDDLMERIDNVAIEIDAIEKLLLKE